MCVIEVGQDVLISGCPLRSISTKEVFIIAELIATDLLCMKCCRECSIEDSMYNTLYSIL